MVNENVDLDGLIRRFLNCIIFMLIINFHPYHFKNLLRLVQRI